MRLIGGLPGEALLGPGDTRPTDALWGVTYLHIDCSCICNALSLKPAVVLAGRGVDLSVSCDGLVYYSLGSVTTLVTATYRSLVSFPGGLSVASLVSSASRVRAFGRNPGYPDSCVSSCSIVSGLTQVSAVTCSNVLPAFKVELKRGATP